MDHIDRFSQLIIAIKSVFYAKTTRHLVAHAAVMLDDHGEIYWGAYWKDVHEAQRHEISALLERIAIDIRSGK